MIKKSDLLDFIKDVFANPDFDGCWYCELGKDLYLVFCVVDNNEVECKIAYNTDDLQCDYDFDWYMPTNKQGDLIGQDWCDVINDYTPEDLCEEVRASYKYIVGCGWKKN